MKKRFLSILLSLCMVLALLPVTAFAEDNEEPTETPVCTCEAACSAEAMNTDCPICGVEGATIENCGKYEAPVEEPEPEQTAIEKVQAMLDALPTVEELEAAEEATVNAAYEAAQDAYDALEALNPEDQEQITGVEKLMTLMKWFNEKTSMTGGVVYNHNNVHGIESGKTYCGDTYFTVDIPAEHLDRVSYYHKASGTYPVLTPDEDGRYKLDAGLGQIAVCVEWGNRETGRHAIDFFGITIYVNHVDIDKDHNCDNGCGKTVGIHEDADLNHICDYGCKEAIGICADADKDHKCDYGCGKDFGTHEDADLNHICDYGCKERIGICADADKDHKCDYGCGKDFGTHEDTDLNHICDYGCKERIGICADADKDHKCDYGCGKTFGVCSGGTATCKDKAVCDYCGKPYGELDSSNHAGGTEVRNAKDAKCTEDGYTGDTYCKGCDMKLQDGKPITKLGHIDADKNHVCDREYCKATLSTCSGGTATCKDKAVCEYCGKPYGELDSSTHAGGTEVRNAKDAKCTEDGYTGDTYCKGCDTKLSSGKSVDKTGHDYESKVTKEATTTSTGTKTYTCKNCGHSYEEEIAKLPSQSTSPQTGDNSNMALWFALLFVSGGALIGTTVYGKKKKYSAK